MADVESFWDEMLLPMYREWCANPEKDHLAKALAQFANNMAERLARYYAIKPGKYREQLRKSCPEFGLIWDLADGAKHVELDRPSAEVSHIDQAKMSKAMQDWGKLSEVKTLTGHQVLIITDNSGSRHKFADLMDAVMAKYREILRKEGLPV